MTVKRWPEDIAFSDAIRESYDYECQSCRKGYRHDRGFIQCAHLHTRRHRNTRWCATYGAIALCAKCHRRYTDFPLEWADFCKRYMGDSNYEEAKRRAWTIRKFTKAERKEIATHYRSERRRIEQLRLAGETGTIRIVSYD